MLKIISDIANKYGKKLTICGEVAGEMKYIPAIIGLGIKNLSMNIVNIRDVKKYIESLEYSECKEIAGKVLKLESENEIDDLLNEFYEKKAKV
jgi:phosphoenolpyruvate-protein kinase (PTS system EI component)